MRLDLLAALPELRSVLLSDFWMESLKFRVVAPLFAAYVALLFIGPQASVKTSIITLET